MLWDILKDKKLFWDTYSVDLDDYDELGHLGHITALLGPPKQILDKGNRTRLFYESGGQ